MRIRFYLATDGEHFSFVGVVRKSGVSLFSLRSFYENVIYCRTNRLGKLFRNDYEVEVMK